MDHRDHRVRLAPPDLPVRAVRLVRLAPPARLARRVRPGPLGRRAQRAPQDLQDPQDPPEQPGPLGRPVLPACLAPLVPPGHPAPPARPDPRVRLDLRDPRVRLDLSARRGSHVEFFAIRHASAGRCRRAWTHRHHGWHGRSRAWRHWPGGRTRPGQQHTRSTRSDGRARADWSYGPIAARSVTHRPPGRTGAHRTTRATRTYGTDWPNWSISHWCHWPHRPDRPHRPLACGCTRPHRPDRSARPFARGSNRPHRPAGPAGPECHCPLGFADRDATIYYAGHSGDLHRRRARHADVQLVHGGAIVTGHAHVIPESAEREQPAGAVRWPIDQRGAVHAGGPVHHYRLFG